MKLTYHHFYYSGPDKFECPESYGLHLCCSPSSDYNTAAIFHSLGWVVPNLGRGEFKVYIEIFANFLWVLLNCFEFSVKVDDYF